MRHVPAPGIGDDRVKVGPARSPPELLANAGGRRVQPRRIARPPWRHSLLDAAPGDTLDRRDNLPNRGWRFAAHVVRGRSTALLETTKRPYVRIRKIHHV